MNNMDLMNMLDGIKSKVDARWNKTDKVYASRMQIMSAKPERFYIHKNIEYIRAKSRQRSAEKKRCLSADSELPNP